MKKNEEKRQQDKKVWIKIENLHHMWNSWHWKIGVRNIFAYLTLRKEKFCAYICEIKPFILHRKSFSYDKVWCLMKRMKESTEKNGIKNIFCRLHLYYCVMYIKETHIYAWCGWKHFMFVMKKHRLMHHFCHFK